VIASEETAGKGETAIGAVRPIPDVVRRTVAGETFLVPIRGRLAELQEIFVLNEVGAWVWDRLDGWKAPADIVVDVAREFAVTEAQALRDIEDFFHQLAEAGLVEKSRLARD